MQADKLVSSGMTNCPRGGRPLNVWQGQPTPMFVVALRHSRKIEPDKQNPLRMLFLGVASGFS